MMAWPNAPILALLSLFCCGGFARAYQLQKHFWYRDYYPDKLDYCFLGCRGAIRGITFDHPDFGDEDNWYKKELSNTLKIQSTYYCAQVYCTDEEVEHGLRYLSKDFELSAGEPLPPLSQYQLSGPELTSVAVITQATAPDTESTPVDHPVIPDAHWHDLAERTSRAFYNTWDVGFDFSFLLITFWLSVVSVGLVQRIGAINRLCKILHIHEIKAWAWTRRRVILPATFGQRQAISVRQLITIPPRLESGILLVYLTINIYMCFPGYVLFAGNQWWDSTSIQLARYVSDRMGFLSIAQLPMIWVFASRNSVLLWLTGWSYATYNRFHRWISTISVALAIGHSLGYTIMELMRGAHIYVQDWQQEYWYMGGIATIIMSLMLPLSAYYLRQRMYDLFLLGHIVLSIVFFVTLWYHVRIFDGEFNYFIYPCISMWLVDRLLRIWRVTKLSIRPWWKNGTRATATYHSDSDTIRLDVTDLLLKQRQIVPGQYYFLYVPAGLRGYESHPFTLCSWRPAAALEIGDDSATPSSPLDGSSDEPEEPKSDDEDEETQVGLLSKQNRPLKVAHTFLIRPYEGMTRRLRNRLLSNASSPESPASPQQMTVLLEGPYGDNLDLSSYSDVLFICGGAGIVTAISHSHYLQEKVTKVHIVWAVPQCHLPDEVCSNELASMIQNGTVRMTVYLTGSKSQPDEDREIEMEKLRDESEESPPYEVKLGRPHVEEVMRQYRQRASQSLAIVTCGTAQMSDTCRKAVVRVLAEEGVYVGYYNQTLMW